MTFILILLGLTALYCGGMWLYLFFRSTVLGEARYRLPEQNDALERYTFHLGLCFILAVGFIGLIANGG